MWDNALEILDDQIFLFGEQHRRLYRLLNKVEYAITDCPILLSIIYGKEASKKFNLPWDREFTDLILKTYCQYDNYNFFVDRGDREYLKIGRLQDREGAIEKDNQIKEMLDNYNIPYFRVKSVDDIIKHMGL